MSDAEFYKELSNYEKLTMILTTSLNSILDSVSFGTYTRVILAVRNNNEIDFYIWQNGYEVGCFTRSLDPTITDPVPVDPASACAAPPEPADLPPQAPSTNIKDAVNSRTIPFFPTFFISFSSSQIKRFSGDTYTYLYLNSLLVRISNTPPDTSDRIATSPPPRTSRSIR